MSSSGANWEKIIGEAGVVAEKLNRLPVHSTISANAALVAGELTPVNAEAGEITVTLPTGKELGTLVAVEKTDATENVVKITGTIRGEEGASDSLKLKRETIIFEAESKTSWRPLADHKTLGSLDTRYERLINIYQYVTSEPNSVTRVFNLKKAMEAVELSGFPLYVPQDGYKYRPLAKSITMNKINTISEGTDKSFRYIIKGAGTNELPSGMSSGDVLLYRNFSSGGSPIANEYGSSPRVVMEDIRVVGGESPSGTFFQSYNSSTHMSRVKFQELLYGGRLEGYNDNDYMDLYATTMTSNGAVIYKDAAGDGGLYKGQFYGCKGYYLVRTNGGRLESIIGGYHKFTDCDLIMDGFHLEGDGPTITTEPLITCTHSRLDIKEGVLYTNVARKGAIVIEDFTSGEGEQHSVLTLGKGMYFQQRLDDPGSEVGDRLGNAIYVKTPSPLTEIAFQGGGSQRITAQDATGSRAGQPFVYTAPLLSTPNENTEEKEILTAFKNKRLLSATDSVFRKRNGVWGFAAPDPLGAIRTTRRLTTNSGTIKITAVAGALSPLGNSWTNLAAGSYFYQAWSVDNEGRATPAAAEVSATISSGEVPQLTINSYISPVTLIIKRGISAGVFTKYVEINLARSTAELWDQGDAIGGVEWLETSLPTTPTINGTYDGIVYAGEGLATIFGTAVPTSGEWIAGTRLFTPTSEFLCVTTGTPGVWEQFESGLRGICRNDNPENVVTTAVLTASGRVEWTRLIEGGTISKTLFSVTIASGNLCIGYAKNEGVGKSAIPGALIAWTGSFACPSASETNVSGGSVGDHEQALLEPGTATPVTVTLAAGDWVAIAADNGTASIRATSTAGNIDTALAAGSSYRETIASESPKIPTARGALTAHVGRNYLIIGR